MYKLFLLICILISLVNSQQIDSTVVELDTLIDPDQYTTIIIEQQRQITLLEKDAHNLDDKLDQLIILLQQKADTTLSN